MIVCNCFGINEKTLRKVLEKGADSLDEVAKLCGAGTDCGSCVVQIQRMIVQKRREEDYVSQKCICLWTPTSPHPPPKIINGKCSKCEGKL